MTTGIICVAMLHAVAAPASEADARSVDFFGGLAVQPAPFADDAAPLLSFRTETRYWPLQSLYLSALLSGELGVDARNPEAIDPVWLVGTGAGIGLATQLVEALSAQLGGSLEWLNGWGWPSNAWPSDKDVHDGVRLTGQVGLTLSLGKAWGHPMAVEVRGGYVLTVAAGRSAHSWIAGLGLTGLLFPEP